MARELAQPATAMNAAALTATTVARALMLVFRMTL
jgi:hypothetical protein